MEHKLTERDIETLQQAYRGGGGGWWFTPLRIGGHSRSHHSATLRKLAKCGLMLAKQRSAPGARGSLVYRLSDAGLDMVKRLEIAKTTATETTEEPK